MRLLGLFLIIAGVFAACGAPSGESKTAGKKLDAKEFARGKTLFDREDCGGCHAENSAIIGPSFRQLAGEYEPGEANISHLAHIAIVGVKPYEGIWGSREMTPHPHLKQEDAEEIVKYMLSFPADPRKPFLHNTK